MSATITWRNGSQTKIDSLFANREYTVREKNTFYPKKEDKPIKQLYENVSDLIDHKHIEKSFDDFAKQSLLPNGFSQIGPGVLWMDIDNDDDQDVFIGGGNGGSIDYYRNDGDSFSAFSIENKLENDATALLSSTNSDGTVAVSYTHLRAHETP